VGDGRTKIGINGGGIVSYRLTAKKKKEAGRDGLLGLTATSADKKVCAGRGKSTNKVQFVSGNGEGQWKREG